MRKYQEIWITDWIIKNKDETLKTIPDIVCIKMNEDKLFQDELYVKRVFRGFKPSQRKQWSPNDVVWKKRIGTTNTDN